MNYPLISEYIEAIKAAEENFEQLKHLRPVLDEGGEPVMTSGNFAVVFKMKDEQIGKQHAVKCFLKEQEGRAEAYCMIAEELEYVNSTFLTPIKYLDKELFVDSKNSDETEFPVLLMDWVEGQTLDKYIREHIDDQYELSLLAYQFSRLAMWLMPQPFAHGDLKPDNILVKDDGTLVLVDYDGMYVPAMKGQKARELGSPDFRHPNRTDADFDEHIDDFSLASILLSLKAISLQPDLLEEYGAADRLLLSGLDYRDISQCKLLHDLFPSDDMDLNKLYSLFLLCLVEYSIPVSLNKSLSLKRPDNKIKNNIPYLLKRATHGDANSQYKLGLCYKEGEDIEKNYEEAVKWFTKAADSNHAKALKELGFCYLWGLGVDINVERALSLYEQAGLYYDKDDYCSLMEHKVVALQQLQKFDECFSILLNYVQPGKGCKKCSMVNQYNQIARCCPWMQFMLGECYEQGRGVSKDYSKGVEWYGKSAEQGDPDAYNRLGVCYALGRGVHQDYKKAVEYFIKSANYGNSDAQKNLGASYEYGDGVEKDYVKAVEWYTKSAEQDNSIGQYNLGRCYESGLGVEKDQTKALQWYRKAAKRGNKDAKQRLEILSNKNRTKVTEVDLANVWTDEFGVKYSADRTRLLKLPNELKEYKVVDGTKVICDMAFFCCTELISVTFPESIELIGERAFFGGKLFGCKKLEHILVPKGEKERFAELLPSLKDKLVEHNIGWREKGRRAFTQYEIAAVEKAEVVASQYGNSVCFFMKSGGQTYIPLSQDSSLTVGDTIDLKTAKLITLCRKGKDDIYRVIE